MVDGCAYLVDTHVFLWSLFSPERVPAPGRRIIENTRNRVLVSAITFWEISLKYSIGKLSLQHYFPHELPDAATAMHLEILPLPADVAASVHLLPSGPHKDPFDRMLAWQAIKSKFILITCDQAIKTYVKDGLRVLRDA